MSLHLPSRRAVRSVAALTSSQAPLSLLTPVTQRRTAFSLLPWKKAQDKNQAKSLNPLTEEFLRRKPAARAGGPKKGSLSPSSIFEDEEKSGSKPGDVQGAQKEIEPRNPRLMKVALDPDPKGRLRWERKMVIREIHTRGRLTKTQRLKREERVSLCKSHDFKTSVKKLVPLAKQIAGKTVADAIVQMRFSKKKVAKEILKHLEHARNEATVRRGMGLGLGGSMDFQPKKIQTNKGERVTVTDPTTIYVDQAWCGKGLFGRTPDYRARGRLYIMKNRTASLSLVLKEEKTRIRLHEEREKKEQKRKVWVQLPNRPITAQRQYYSW